MKIGRIKLSKVSDLLFTITMFMSTGPKLNGQVLAEFSRVQETAPEPSLRVKSATLWIYVHLKSTHHNHGGTKHGHLHGASEKSRQPHSHHLHGHSRTTRPPTLYIFRILPHQDSSSINSSLDKVNSYSILFEVMVRLSILFFDCSD